MITALATMFALFVFVSIGIAVALIRAALGGIAMLVRLAFLVPAIFLFETFLLVLGFVVLTIGVPTIAAFLLVQILILSLVFGGARRTA